MSQGRPGTPLLPCWADRAQAEMRLVGPGKDMVAAEIGLAAFCDRLRLWVADTGRLVAPQPFARAMVSSRATRRIASPGWPRRRWAAVLPPSPAGAPRILPVVCGLARVLCP